MRSSGAFLFVPALKQGRTALFLNKDLTMPDKTA
jgi:hypothetical protein